MDGEVEEEEVQKQRERQSGRVSEREGGTDRVVESTTGERYLGRGEAGGRGERAVCVWVSLSVCVRVGG